MKKITAKKKRYLASRSRTQLKKLKRNRKFRLNKIGHNSYLNQLKLQRKNIEKENRKPGSTLVSLSPANNFSILKSANKVIAFISQLKNYAKPPYAGYKIHIDISNVTEIDAGAISLLLSAVEELSQYDIYVTGNLPVNPKCNQIFINSGYLAHMKSLSGKRLPFQNKTKNSILKTGKDKTRNKDVGIMIKKAVEMLTGIEDHYRPIYSIVQEITGNSVEHAYKDKSKEHWIFSVNYDQENEKVIFTFADNGFGILKTLRRKLTQQFFDGLDLKDDAEILTGAYQKKYESRHRKQINRNKGLPLLKKIQEDTSIKNLFVITNNVLLFLSSDKTFTINRNFSGTFYYWELDTECIERWKTKQMISLTE